MTAYHTPGPVSGSVDPAGWLGVAAGVVAGRLVAGAELDGGGADGDGLLVVVGLDGTGADDGQP